MKKKVFKTKLSLNKSNIANLSNLSMKNAKGGNPTTVNSEALECFTKLEDSVCPCIHPETDPFTIVVCETQLKCEGTANC